jgi:hypothetical protein
MDKQINGKLFGQIAKRWRRLEKAQQVYQRRIRREHKLGFTISPPPAKGSTRPNEEGDPELRYHISGSRNKPVDISILVRKNAEDPAYKV